MPVTHADESVAAGVPKYPYSSDKSAEYGVGVGTIPTAPNDKIDEATIKATLDSVFLDIEQQRIDLIAKRDEALADGMASVAEGYDRQINGLEKNIAELQRQIEASGSLEAWYRNEITGPMEAAKAAALATDFTSTNALAGEALRASQAVSAQSDARLADIMTQLGFAPGQSAVSAEDQAILGGVQGELAATAMRPEMLEASKKLDFALSDLGLKSELRQSVGRAAIVSERNRRGILEAQDQIGELNKYRDEALARVEREVNRQYGSGLELPDRDSYVKSAMDKISEALMAGVAPGIQEALSGLAGAVINSGTKVFNRNTLTNMMRNGQIGDFGDDATVAEYQSALELYNQLKGTDDPRLVAERQRVFGIMQKIEKDAFDDEDVLIVDGLVKTWQKANSTYDKMIEQQVNQSTADSYGKYDNRSAKNIEAAKKGQGAYGRRRIKVAQYAETFKKMWGRTVQGQNYFRPTETFGKGRAKNSDHMTAGALDIFFNSSNGKDMEYYNRVVRPHLEDLRRKGVIKSIIHPGQNAAHKDHVHISFTLDDAGQAHTT
jgi:hypothetical protein